MERQTARLIADVENGVYDDRARPPDLIDLGPVMFRVDALEGTAREKAHSLGSVGRAENIDAIEVYVAYQNKLRERLGLQHVAPNMRFFEVSGVTEADVVTSSKTVRSKDDPGFADYLATDWQPWDDVVSRIAFTTMLRCRTILLLRWAKSSTTDWSNSSPTET
nr:NEL-type E3 ubiquitin ligase domain-containing protein [Bradyrhizobium yuanmingense]